MTLSNFKSIRLAKAFVSLEIVMAGMLAFTCGMVYFCHVSFSSAFPGEMDWGKAFATWFMSFGWEFTVLITTCNPDHVKNKWLPPAMAIASGINLLFFLEAFDFSIPALVIVYRWFIAILSTIITYVYAELFYAKLAERLKQLAVEEDLDSKDKQFIELQQAINDKQEKLNQRDEIINDLQKQLAEQAGGVGALEGAMAEIIQLLGRLNEHYLQLNAATPLFECNHCDKQFPDKEKLRTHKVYCEKNPNRRIKKGEANLEAQSAD